MTVSRLNAVDYLDPIRYLEKPGASLDSYGDTAININYSRPFRLPWRRL